MTISALAPCASCARHVRVGGEECPFCGASLLGIAAPEPRKRTGARWTRAALFAGTALLGSSALGCGGSAASTETEETVVEETPVEETSGDETVPEEGAPEEGTPEEGGAESDPSQPHTLYGGPPAEAFV